jgi:Mg-chelatase subunit ChlD
MSTVECFNCHQRVRDLKQHKSSGKCRQQGPRSTQVSSSTTPTPTPKRFECYDCHQFVADLKAHRSQCKHYHGPKVEPSSSSSTKNAKTQAVVSATAMANSKDVYVLVDVSGSMTGNKLTQAKQALSDIHDFLREDDRLAIVTFDSHAYFKLKPRPNGQVKRQNELPDLLERIFAQGGTALYDAIHLSIDQMLDKQRPTLFVVLTDGEDNSSTHSCDAVLKLVEAHQAITLDIVEIAADARQSRNVNYGLLAQHGRGTYDMIAEKEIVATVVKRVKRIFQ